LSDNSTPVVNKKRRHLSWSYSPLVESIYKKIYDNPDRYYYLDKNQIAKKLEQNENPLELIAQ
ncbi:MAG: hypothetical protein VXX85_05250, partial [Candidatus Margulisiibacteriota bacterium]|nr:hypothetical protein [Candidatus Margulisiibacteriota bacterium]